MSFLSNVPFIGKHKTLLGSAGLFAGTVLGYVGLPELGTQVTDIALGVTGLGLLHKGAKSRGAG